MRRYEVLDLLLRPVLLAWSPSLVCTCAHTSAVLLREDLRVGTQGTILAAGLPRVTSIVAAELHRVHMTAVSIVVEQCLLWRGARSPVPVMALSPRVEDARLGASSAGAMCVLLLRPGLDT